MPESNLSHTTNLRRQYVDSLNILYGEMSAEELAIHSLKFSKYNELLEDYLFLKCTQKFREEFENHKSKFKEQTQEPQTQESIDNTLDSFFNPFSTEPRPKAIFERDYLT